MGTAKTSTLLPTPPYKLIAKSKPFWALILTFICGAWSFHTLLTEIPTYLNNIQHIPLTAVRRIFFYQKKKIVYLYNFYRMV